LENFGSYKEEEDLGRLENGNRQILRLDIFECQVEGINEKRMQVLAKERAFRKQKAFQTQATQAGK